MPILNQKYAYHIAPSSKDSEIKQNGLKTKDGKIYLWADEKYADWFKEFHEDGGEFPKDMTKWLVDISGLDLKVDPETEDMSYWSSTFNPGEFGQGYIFYGSIPVNRIKQELNESYVRHLVRNMLLESENKSFHNLDGITTEEVLNLIEYADSFRDLYPGHAPDYENTYEEDYYFPSKQEAYESVNAVLEFFTNLPEPFPVFRTIKVKSKDDIDFSYLGDSWSYSKDGAINFARNHAGGNVLLSGKIKHEDVDWKETLRCHFLFTDQFHDGSAEEEVKINDTDKIIDLQVDFLKK